MVGDWGPTGAGVGHPGEGWGGGGGERWVNKPSKVHCELLDCEEVVLSHGTELTQPLPSRPDSTLFPHAAQKHSICLNSLPVPCVLMSQVSCRPAAGSKLAQEKQVEKADINHIQG